MLGEKVYQGTEFEGLADEIGGGQQLAYQDIYLTAPGTAHGVRKTFEDLETGSRCRVLQFTLPAAQQRSVQDCLSAVNPQKGEPAIPTNVSVLHRAQGQIYHVDRTEEKSAQELPCT